MGGGRNRSSSSSEDDGDAEWRAAIDSVTASVATYIKQDSGGCASRVDETHEPQNVKHYQMKAQKVLDDILEKTLEVVTVTAHTLEKDPASSDTGVRLFKHAPIGIVFDHAVELDGPKKKPKIVPGEVLDEKSKKFRKQLRSAVIDGADIIAASRAAVEKSLTKVEAREAAAKAAAKREEERVAELKRIRGERWLPSVAKHMRLATQYKR
ncbi:hypothetical protein OROHE_002519 [Orobanche hederae]